MSNMITVGSSGGYPAGLYPAQFAGSETRQTRDLSGEFRIWNFKLGDGRDFDGVSSLSFGPRSKGYKWLTALLGRGPVAGEEIDLDSLIGKPCILSIIIDDEGWSRLDAVLPPAVDGPGATFTARMAPSTTITVPGGPGMAAPVSGKPSEAPGELPF